MFSLREYILLSNIKCVLSNITGQMLLLVWLSYLHVKARGIKCSIKHLSVAFWIFSFSIGSIQDRLNSWEVSAKPRSCNIYKVTQITIPCTTVYNYIIKCISFLNFSILFLLQVEKQF